MSQFESKWDRVTDDDPQRCQHIIPTMGQCKLRAVEGSQYCPAHGGNKAFQANERKNLKNYRLTQFKSRVQELGNSEAILSLKDEIGILRLLIEERMNRCTDTNDLLLVSGPLGDLIMKVEKIVKSCDQLESKLGNFLSRDKILQFAQIIVQIVSKYLDENQLNILSSEILEALNSL